MRKWILFFALLLLLLPQISEAQKLENSPLMNKPMPVIEGLTLNGKKIDKAYFKGKVTLVNFMFIGCMGCMKEIPVLNKLHSNNSENKRIQVLGISANTAEQLRHFNGDDTTIYSRVRTKTYKIDPVAYDLMAECEKEKVKPAHSIGSECKTISEKFLLTSHPLTILIDKKGLVRYVFSGFPMAIDENKKLSNQPEVIEANNNRYLAELQAEIEKLLKE